MTRRKTRGVKCKLRAELEIVQFMAWALEITPIPMNTEVEEQIHVLAQKRAICTGEDYCSAYTKILETEEGQRLYGKLYSS